MASRVDFVKLGKDYMPLPIGIKRGNPIPIDTSSIYQSETAMRNYAKDDGTAYVGQILSLADGYGTKAFIITDELGNVDQLATSGSIGEISSSIQTLSGTLSAISSAISGMGTLTGFVTLGTAQSIQGDKSFYGGLSKRTRSNDGVQGWGDVNFITQDGVLAGSVIGGCSNATQHDIHLRAYKGTDYSGIACANNGTTKNQTLEGEPTADDTSTASTQIASRGWVNSHFSRGSGGSKHEQINIQQTKGQWGLFDDVRELAAWLLDNTICRELKTSTTHVFITTDCIYENNDELRVTGLPGGPYIQTLAGCQITMSGYYKGEGDFSYTLEIKFCAGKGAEPKYPSDLNNHTLVYRRNCVKGGIVAEEYRVYADLEDVSSLSTKITTLSGYITSLQNQINALSGTYLRSFFETST